MKYIKYITMVLLVGLFAACSDKDVTYDMDKANDANQAYVQIFNMAPIANTAANYAYMVDINGYEYQNNYASTLLPRNGIPNGGTNLFFTVNAGALNIKLYKKENVLYQRDSNGIFYVDGHGVTTRVNVGDLVHFISGDKAVFVNGEAVTGHFEYNTTMDIVGKTVRDVNYTALERFQDDPYYTGATTLEAGKRYHVFIYDMEKDPLAVEMEPIPALADVSQQFDGVTDIIGAGCNGKFYNFLYESNGQPFTKKLQVYLYTRTEGTANVRANYNVETKVGKPFGFGEASEWVTIPLVKSVYNSSGYDRAYYRFHVIDANGNDEGELTYNRDNKVFEDYWSYYVGRAYLMFAIGVRDGSGVTMATPRWTSQ